MIEAEIENSKFINGKKLYYKKEEELHRNENILVNYNIFKKSKPIKYASKYN